MSNIVNENIEEYIRQTLKKSEGFFVEMEEYAHENNVPIIQKEVAELIKVLIKIHKPKKILEIGTAIGYSAILFASSSDEKVQITTFERNPKMIQKAKENIKRAGLEDQITIIEGDAQENLENFSQEDFDMIFIDAAKGHYKLFYDLTIDKLKVDGLILSDNILHKGMVASDEYVIRRQKTIVKRMRDYLSYISSVDYLDTTLIPISDGFAISYKKK